MRYPYSDAKGGLPVALQFMAGEGIVPVGHAVEFTDHAPFALLSGNALDLLGGIIFQKACQHIDAGQMEMGVGTHTVAYEHTLFFHEMFIHQMAGEHDAVFLAPFADDFAVAFGISVGNEIMAVILHLGQYTIGSFPEYFRQLFQKIVAVSLGKGFGEALCPRDAAFCLTGAIFHGLQPCKLWFIGKDGRNGLAEFLT